MSESGSQRHRVVIIGSGFGGLFAAKHLKRADVDVTLIAKTTSAKTKPTPMPTTIIAQPRTVVKTSTTKFVIDVGWRGATVSA